MYVDGTELTYSPFSSRELTSPNPLLTLAEAEHRTANEFALAACSINLIARTCSGAAREALTRAAARLCDYAQAHRALLPPVDSDVLDLSAHLGDICRALSRASLAERRIAVSLQERPTTIETWRAWRAGLIVAELITNSARHGVWPIGGGIIRVEITADDFEICCRVSDNGRGPKTRSRGTGSHIAEALTREMRGQICTDFRNDGVTTLLTVPRHHAWAQRLGKSAA